MARQEVESMNVDRSDELAEWYAEDNEDGATVLDDLLDTLVRYVVFPDSHAAAAVALWIVVTHVLAAFQHAPRLVAISPQKRCGKSRLLDVIAGTCHRPLMSINATVAAIFRSIGDDNPPTLIIDEADTLFGTKRAAEQNEDLRALLNAGHQRGRPALRCVGPHQIPTEFPTFAAAALAGIGSMPDTITDRAINLTMRRRTRGERVAQFRTRRDGPILAALQRRIAAWGARHLNELAAAEPDMPVEDRAADTWEPLIAVADAAGGQWPSMAREACRALVDDADDADEESSLSTKLLADIKATFTDKHASFLSSADLVAALRDIEESPWSDFELNPRKLASRLKQFGISPGHNTTKTARGYTLEGLADAFERYTRPNPSNTSETYDDLPEERDGTKSPDGYIRPPENVRPDETADQTPFRTVRTLPDAPAPKNRNEDPFCKGCGTYFAVHGKHRTDCTASPRQQAIVAAQSRLNGTTG
jgi:hypothetical protein